ncbi:MAG: hypothetical protein GYA24_09380 [Candidatus Lokiarchaeota archaeon]|nr:hypothetical protein [Candidatus Lokiarchaeota archaeon]
MEEKPPTRSLHATKKEQPPYVDLRTLSNCILNGDVTLMKQYLDDGGDPNRGEYGCTLLHEAVNFKQARIVKLLIDAGANVNVKDRDLRQPLHFALEYPPDEIPPMVTPIGFTVYATRPPANKEPGVQVEIVTMLLNAGAEVNPRKVTGSITQGALYMFQPPLSMAARAGNVAMVKLLLEHGADVDATDYFECPALIEAVNAGSFEAVKLLVEAGANVNAQQRFGDSALVRAIHGRDLAISEFKNTAGRAGKQAIDDGIKEIEVRFARIFEYLVTHGANLELVDDSGQTVLFSSINDANHLALVQLLAEGANVHHRDGEGRTPLHFAVHVVTSRKLPEDSMIPLIKALLEAGARSGEKDKAGKTALDLAREHELHGLAALLA